MDSSPTTEPTCPAFERLLKLGVALVLPPFLAIAFWRSGAPEVLGIWSTRLFALLCVYAAGLLLAFWLCFHRGAAGLRQKLLVRIIAIRQSKPAAWAVAALPVAAFAAVLLLVLGMGVVPSPLVIGCFANLALLVFWAEVLLAISGRPDRERRLLTLKLTAAGLATVLTLAAIEAGAFLLGVNRFATWDINPKNLNVRFQTDDFDTRVVTSSQGLREPNLIPPRSPDAYRVLVIGDSMTFGWGVEGDEAYPKVAEQLLREERGRKQLEVINMGRPGAGPHEYLKYLRKYGSKLNPDLVVIGFLIGNDTPINSPPKLTGDKDIQAALQHYVNEANESVADQLLAKSFLVRLGYSLLNRRSEAPAAAGVKGPIFSEPNPLDPQAVEAMIDSLTDREAATVRYHKLLQEGWIERGLNWRINPWLLHAIIRNPGGAGDTLAVRPETFAAMQIEWKLIAALMDEIRVTARDELQAELLVLAIPNAHLVSQRWVDFLGERGCIVNEDMTEKRIVNDWLQAWCDKHDVVNIDPVETFRTRQAESDDLYLQTDDHMTPKGYRLLAEALAEAIDELISENKRRE